MEEQLDTCSQNITEQIELLIGKCLPPPFDKWHFIVGQFVRRQTGQYKKAIFHLVWSPSACPTDECLKPLIKLLDAELSLVHRCLLHRNVRIIFCAYVLFTNSITYIAVHPCDVRPSATSAKAVPGVRQ